MSVDTIKCTLRDGVHVGRAFPAILKHSTIVETSRIATLAAICSLEIAYIVVVSPRRLSSPLTTYTTKSKKD